MNPQADQLSYAVLVLLRCDVVMVDLDELVLDLHHRARREEAGEVVNAVPVEDEIAECWVGQPV